MSSIDVVAKAPADGTPAEFGAYFRNDVEKWRKVVQAAGVSAE